MPQDYQLQLADRLRPSLATFAPSIELQERPWYNANLESRWFFVPGVIGTLVLVSVMTLTAFAVVREREIGTLEQLMVTPISPAELIVGKTLPFLLVGLANVIVVAILGSCGSRFRFAEIFSFCCSAPRSFCRARSASDC